MRRALCCLAAGVWLSGCAGAKAAVPPRTHQVFIDISGSIADEQRALWKQMVLSEVHTRLVPGDEVLLFLVTERSSLEVPRRLPATVAPDGTLTGDVNSAESVRRLEAELDAVLQQLLQSRRKVRQTDLLGVVDRLARRPSGSSVEALIFSDMEEESDDVDLARRPPASAEEAGQLVRRQVQGRGWTSDSLKGVRVSCFLPTTGNALKRPLAHRRALEGFWRTLIVGLGGELSHYDVF
jgi:hypothetical protein